MKAAPKNLDELMAIMPPEERRAAFMRCLAGDKDVCERDAQLRRLLMAELKSDPGSRSIDQAFGFVVRGGKSPAKSARLDQRNALLVDLWRHDPEWQKLSASAVARVMITSFKRYEAGRWLQERDNLTPPSKEPARTWWLILSLPEMLPGTVRGVLNILQMEIQ